MGSLIDGVAARRSQRGDAALRNRWTIAALILCIVVGCQPAHDTTERDLPKSIRAPNAGTANHSVVASLDSCNALPWPGDTAGTQLGHSAWSTGKVRTFGRVSIFVPERATATVVDTTLGVVTLEWRECPMCKFGVEVDVDSAGTGVEGQVARQVAAQRRIDSINADPKTTAMEFDEINGTPEPFTTEAGRGYRIEDNCGDCMAIRLLFGQPGYIATVALGGDAGAPMLARHACEMLVLGKTLRWRMTGMR